MLVPRPTTTTRISPPSNAARARSARFSLHRKRSLRSLNLKGSCRLQQSSYEFHAESVKNWNAKWNGICTGHVWCTSSPKQPKTVKVVEGLKTPAEDMDSGQQSMIITGSTHGLVLDSFQLQQKCRSCSLHCTLWYYWKSPCLRS